MELYFMIIKLLFYCEDQAKKNIKNKVTYTLFTPIKSTIIYFTQIRSIYVLLICDSGGFKR